MQLFEGINIRNDDIYFRTSDQCLQTSDTVVQSTTCVSWCGYLF